MSRLKTAFIIKVSSIVLVTLGTFLYVLYTARGLIIGPQITVLHPDNGISTTTPTITIYGHVLSSKKLTLNDFPISITSEGDFSEIVLLHEGYNIIRIQNTDRFGRNDIELLEFTRIVEKPIEKSLYETGESNSTQEL